MVLCFQTVRFYDFRGFSPQMSVAFFLSIACFPVFFSLYTTTKWSVLGTSFFFPDTDSHVDICTLLLVSGSYRSLYFPWSKWPLGGRERSISSTSFRTRFSDKRVSIAVGFRGSMLHLRSFLPTGRVACVKTSKRYLREHVQKKSKNEH